MFFVYFGHFWGFLGLEVKIFRARNKHGSFKCFLHDFGPVSCVF